MKRRDFLAAAGVGSALSVLDWLSFFKRNGIPGGAKDRGIAESVAQAADTAPSFLVYWFLEGGWDGFSMFNPVATKNAALEANGDNPQIYRPNVPLVGGLYPVQQKGAISYGHLAQLGAADPNIFNEMCVISSHYGSEFHSGSRLEYHYGKYNYSLSARRGADERTVMQAFCETYGQPFLISNLHWHKWLADGELSFGDYPEGTGYYEKLGPAYAHTLYAGTPQVMRERIAAIAKSKGTGRDAAVHKFVDNLHNNFMKDKNSDSVRAFQSAVQIHTAFATGGASIDPATLFTDGALRTQFNVQAADEQTDSTSVNGNPARSKDSPHTNVQALMAYEMFTRGLSISAFIESRDIRGFDSHRNRAFVLNNKGQYNQKPNIDKNLWNPLIAFRNAMKNKQYGATGKSYWDYTTVVLASEMGRHMEGGDDDVAQHNKVNSCAFLGGKVKGGTQFGRSGAQSRDAIPILSDGSLDPAYDPATGFIKSGMQKSNASFVPDAGHVYATALDLCGIPKAEQKGKNDRPVLSFVKKV